MSAKDKLNSAHFLGALVVAGLFGAVTDSIQVFLFTLVALVFAGFMAGDIRR